MAALQVPFCRADPPRGALVNVVGTVNVDGSMCAKVDAIAATPAARTTLPLTGKSSVALLLLAVGLCLMGLGVSMAMAPGRSQRRVPISPST